jgi:hypothetical protein
MYDMMDGIWLIELVSRMLAPSGSSSSVGTGDDDFLPGLGLDINVNERDKGMSPAATLCILCVSPIIVLAWIRFAQQMG